MGLLCAGVGKGVMVIIERKVRNKMVPIYFLKNNY